MRGFSRVVSSISVSAETFYGRGQFFRGWYPHRKIPFLTTDLQSLGRRQAERPTGEPRPRRARRKPKPIYGKAFGQALMASSRARGRCASLTFEQEGVDLPLHRHHRVHCRNCRRCF